MFATLLAIGTSVIAEPRDTQSLRLAIEDLARSFPERYNRAPEFLNRLAAVSNETGFAALQREALLANPLLDFDRLLFVRRGEKNLALPQNWESNSSLPRSGIENEIAVLEDLRGSPRAATVFQPGGGRFVGDLALHFDADRFLFSSPGEKGRWQVFELGLAGGEPRQLPLIPDDDVDNYTACYLPDDSILFTSTAPFVGVPCVRGGSHVANLFRFWPESGKIRRLTFDQEHNWCPTALPDGRVMYLRWEYSDLPHFVSRILFTMNPDGTNQRELYGSNSYWPNAFFYAKPLPGDPRKVAGIVGGHHGVPRMGELVSLDPWKGRFEAGGVVQRIPGRGQRVEAKILDQLVDASWPKFLHPAPLSAKYFLVSCKPAPASSWGLYLVDVFDNMVLLREDPGYALLEPTPVLKRPRPPVIPDSVREDRKTARMQIVDLYSGPGLRGVPRGTVKKLRLITYSFSYQNIGGQIDRVGIDGPWDIKRVLGTVPVEEDGSANFEVPANVPISMQPLDAGGRALALMRSWTTAMPGESQSCLGCHESQNTASSQNRVTLASAKPPASIEPWHGPPRGFSFDREVQPVLDRHCVACHDGKPRSDGASLPDFTRRPHVEPDCRAETYRTAVRFPPAYLALKSYVRTPTMESDIHLLPPCDYHASTTELIQRLERGHHGVQLDAESWDRLFTWIDLNTPAHGTWTEIAGAKRVGNQAERRRDLLRRYAGTDDDSEKIVPGPDWKPGPPPKEPAAAATDSADCPGWPFDAVEARRRQDSLGETRSSIDMGDGLALPLVLIPPGRFLAGGGETPRRAAEVQRPIWMGEFEVTNEQFGRFDPAHDSRLERGDFLHFSERERGFPLNQPKQPVCRVSWDQAQAFCAWLSAKSGKRIRLPSGVEWEYACRAGADTPLWYGPVDADFARFANLAGIELRQPETLGWDLPSGAVPAWRPAVTNVNDGARASAPVGSYEANAWGLRDMHGNVWEWTADAAADGVRRQVRGGSWYVRPQRATASASLDYAAWQGVYDVGFRVVMEDHAKQP
jgi:formylglycine-generating enzyme required for sulfatase activity